MVAVATELTNVLIRSVKMRQEVSSVVTRADLDMSTDEVSQLTLDIEDPYYPIARRGVISVGALVNYRDLRLQCVARQLNGGGSGTGGVKMVARPAAVQKLKYRVGPLVMRNVSPSQFVQAECHEVGLKVIAQPSSKRKTVARDVYQKGSYITGDANRPSTWTTFKRLADELGYILFETSGVIYFGSPHWITDKAVSVYVSWRYGDSKWWANEMPVVDENTDARNYYTVSVILPIERADDVRPGKALVLGGMPGLKYNVFLITQVSFDLSDPTGQITVQAATPTNIVSSAGYPVKNRPFPLTKYTREVLNTAVDEQTFAVEPRTLTKSASDMAYWAQQLLSSDYDVIRSPDGVVTVGYNELDGLDLVNYTAAQVGARQYTSVSALLAACVAARSKVAYDVALRTPGTLLFGNGWVGIVTSNKRSAEPNGSVYNYVNYGSTSRIIAAATYPGVK